MTEPKSVGELIERVNVHVPEGFTDEQAGDEVRAQRDAVRLEQWAHRVPPRFLGATTADFPDEVAQELESWDGERNLLLLGPVGVGKTHAAVAAARRHHFDGGKHLHFWPVVELLDALRPRGDEDVDFSEVLGAPILMLDDLASERATDWTTERLYAIVNRRWLQECPTIVTTNIPPDRAEEAFGERLLSRLVHDALVIRLRGDDRRR